MREMWSEANKLVQRSAVALGQVGLSDTIVSLAEEEACVAKMQAAFERCLRSCNVWTCKYEPDLQAIMDDYFGGKPPFGAGRKKAEFPDAIVASMLRVWCAATEQAVYIVSLDGDLKGCCLPEGPLICAASVAEVVSHGNASVAVHDAVVAAVRSSEWLFRTMQSRVSDLSVEVESG
jgi:PIN domain